MGREGGCDPGWDLGWELGWDLEMAFGLLLARVDNTPALDPVHAFLVGRGELVGFRHRMGLPLMPILQFRLRHRVASVPLRCSQGGITVASQRHYGGITASQAKLRGVSPAAVVGRVGRGRMDSRNDGTSQHAAASTRGI